MALTKNTLKSIRLARESIMEALHDAETTDDVEAIAGILGAVIDVHARRRHIMLRDPLDSLPDGSKVESRVFFDLLGSETAERVSAELAYLITGDARYA